MIVKQPILPKAHKFAKLRQVHEVNYEAICIFVALGFFLDQDTYWKDEVCLSPAHTHHLDTEGFLVESERNFKWHYNPDQRTFNDVLEEYIYLLTRIIKEQSKDHRIILPLSGGLDSRSQALVLSQLENEVQSYSYSFENGYPEDEIAGQIAKVCEFDFLEFKVKKGYLWHSIDQLGEINGYYSEFTHPRQMAIFNEISKMNGRLSLGHWGDVLFDSAAPPNIKECEIIPLLWKKMVKKQGFQLALRLWQVWNLDGDFESYFTERLSTLLNQIDIEHPSAKVRAFKTKFWAHRWTTTNLAVFSAARPMDLPYYHDDMCKFICRVPENYLANRQLQMAHLKTNKALASITWHANRPFNLLNYHKNKVPYNLPYRINSKLRRSWNALNGNSFVQRNWELQFLGESNDNNLKSYLYSNSFHQFIPRALIDEFYFGFEKEDPINFAHAISMLLTLSVWHKSNIKKS